MATSGVLVASSLDQTPSHNIAEDDHLQILEPAPVDDPAPDGGFRAWLTVFGSCCGISVSFGLLNTMGAIQSYVANHQLKDVSESSIGWIFSLVFCIGVGCSFLGGEVFDRYGPTYPVLAGVVLSTAGLIATGSCKEFYQFILALSVTTGLGCALLMSPLVGAVSHYFNKRLSLAIGIATLGGSIGGTVFPMMLNQLYDKVGFTWALRALALVCFALSLTSSLIVRSRHKPERKREEVMSLKRLARSLSKTVDIDSLIHDRQFLYMALGNAAGEMAIVATSTMYPSYALATGNSSSVALLQVTLISVIGIPTRFIGGYLGDSFGSFNVAILCIASYVLFSLAIWLPCGKYVPGLYLFSCLFGISCAAMFSTFPACTLKISRIENIGRRYSTVYFVTALGTLFTFPIGGAIIGDGTIARYNAFIVFMAALGAISVAFVCLARAQAVGWKLAKY